ncbi:unnamed protein product [Ceratitis capitata]|uniref:(Mediterranean fruit fly) hypothetical protein n=1 Tax=Ceratitis capitata TaxID=7213 RepID=A0A811UHC2_CERCA|nr:unnamed protein product [Ceratitis capitata]
MFVNMDNCQEKMEQQDNASTRAPEEVDLELMHRNFFDSAEERRTEYYALYRQLISELRSSHLEGFANVLMKQQKHVVKNQHELICEMKEQLMRSLQIHWIGFGKNMMFQIE